MCSRCFLAASSKRWTPLMTAQMNFFPPMKRSRLSRLHSVSREALRYSQFRRIRPHPLRRPQQLWKMHMPCTPTSHWSTIPTACSKPLRLCNVQQACHHQRQLLGMSTVYKIRRRRRKKPRGGATDYLIFFLPDFVAVWGPEICCSILGLLSGRISLRWHEGYKRSCIFSIG
jgi:hypothetical protein